MSIPYPDLQGYCSSADSATRAWVCQGGSKDAQQALTWRTLEAHAGAEPPSLEASRVTILAKLPAS